MRLPFGWFAPAVAIAATGIAVWAGSDLRIAVPATAIAVTAAGFLLAEVALRTFRPRPSAPAPPSVDVKANLGRAFRSSRFGRVEILVTLDRVERILKNPGLPGRSLEEIESVVRLPPADFRAYVRRRLSDLEHEA